MRRRASFAVLAVFLSLAGCSGPDLELVRACADIVPALEPSNSKLRLLPARSIRSTAGGVHIPFIVIAPDGGTRQRYIDCAFENPHSLAEERARLTAVESDEGPLNQAQFYFLQRFWINSPDSIAEGRQRIIVERHDATPEWLAYFVQALVNAAPWTAIITLLATAYSLLYGLSHRINLAFGDMAIVGAYAVVASLTAASALGGAPALAVTISLAAGIGVAALAARTLSNLVVTPLVAKPGRMLLVATIGVEIAIQEGLRITKGAGSLWIKPLLATPHILFTGGGFPVHVTTMQMVVAASALCLAFATLAIMRWSRFGLFWRALSEDRLAAMLCGVSPERVLTLTMIGTGLLSGACGAIITLAYGNAHYSLGTLLGLKAVIAAILGGIGSVGGALLGGLMLGLFEGLWSAYVSIESRDIAVYAMLSIILIVRPGGLLGLAAPSPREV